MTTRCSRRWPGSPRVCAYDRPETGADLSSPGSQPHTVDRDVEDLHALLAALGEQEPVVLVAHSYGGLVATLFARTYPQSVAGLVMADAASELIADVITPAKLASWDEVNRVTSPQLSEGVQVIDAINRINAAPPDAPGADRRPDRRQALSHRPFAPRGRPG